MTPRFYITTPIYYPNANLHLGHAYTTITADVLARYKKMQGYEVFLVTGADEHGQKIAKKAAENNQSPQVFVDYMVQKFKNLWEKLDINYQQFIRTSAQSHVETVQKIFTLLLQQDDLYLGHYQGWYCIACEAFSAASQINKINNSCQVCQGKLINIAEATYFFKVGKYTKQLLNYYEKHPLFLWPLHRKTEMINNFIKPGLNDLSITRTSFTWGIKVLENPQHIVYVWIDALSNYLTALGFLQADDRNFKKFWLEPNCEIVHIIGKEISRFHMIYWPILLMALNLRQPSAILAHGWIINEVGKMSKTKGNVIDPLILIERYQADSLRFFLMKEMVFGNDAKYSHELFLNCYNSFLANDLGNLLARTTAMIIKYCDGKIPTITLTKITNNETDIIDKIKKTISDFKMLMDQFHINEAINLVFELITVGNKLIDLTKPWTLYQTNQTIALHNILNLLGNILVIASALLSPILVKHSWEIHQQLGLVQIIMPTGALDLNGISNKVIKNPKILFPRLNIKTELTYLDNYFNK